MTGRSRILYVEDDDSFAKLVEAVLQDYHIEVIQKFEEGIARLKSEGDWDLVLVNMNLTPHDDKLGAEILEYVRDHCPALPRIVITATVSGPIFAEFHKRYQVNEILLKHQFRGHDLRKAVREALGSPFGIDVTQTHKRIPRYVLHHYQRERLRGFPKAQLFELAIEAPVSRTTEVSVVFPECSPYIQKTIHPCTIEPGMNRLFVSPLFTGEVGDGAEIGVSDIEILAGDECIWRSKHTFFFQVTETIPIRLVHAAKGDGWVHFLLATCVTPNSPEVEKLAAEVRHAWKQEHPGERWRASRYSGTDAESIAGYLRVLLGERLIAEGAYIPDVTESRGVIEHNMRLPDEILRSGGANCLYYGLLYASVMENLGIQPLLLFLPGHVMPGWKSVRSSLPFKFEPGSFDFLSENCIFIESTRTSFRDVSFEEMMEMGQATFRKAKKLRMNNQPVYLVDIAQLRREGFTPYGC